MNWQRLRVVLLFCCLLGESTLAQSEKESSIRSVGAELDLDPLLAARLTEEELKQGWIRLFDGQTLMGWSPTEGANWQVINGAITATEGTNSLLCTSVPFVDYEVSLEFRAEEKTNSGLFLRTPLVPTDPARDCFELNIAPNDNPFPTGSLVFRQKRNETIPHPAPNQWHALRAVVRGTHVETWLNGDKTCEYEDTTNLRSGWIGLQFREGKIEFREIKVRPLADEVLVGKMDSFKPAVNVVADYDSTGAMTISGGRGYVESAFLFGDGVVQFSAETLKANVNSGVFFRCIPGEDMNGYECQLHHGYTESRLKPVDSGSGAIFRRQPARAVLSDEGLVTHITVVASGARISTWVQGVQVVEFEDKRKPDPNPRRGLRVDPGTLMLQGHDPECKVKFHSIKIQAYPGE
ncbi:MAG: DUF1080 domain-containing protein [Pirellula sp.]|jgi:hypothetical protein|nr:DUF1080 domain-containing protein [Pirellula sp.]